MSIKNRKELFYSETDSPLGLLGMAHTSKGVCSILFPEEKPFSESLLIKFPNSNLRKENSDSSGCEKQLKEYFHSRRIDFELNLDLNLPKFYRETLYTVLTIPYGKTASYKEIAIKTGNPSGFRAVGNANAQNPIPIIIPCHRVIKHNGNLGGYGGKIERKAFLLEHEKQNQNLLN